MLAAGSSGKMLCGRGHVGVCGVDEEKGGTCARVGDGSGIVFSGVSGVRRR